MSGAVSQAGASSSVQFIVIDNQCSALFPIVEDFFHQQVESIYGPQPEELRDIGEGSKFICELLFEQDLPKGLLIYKRALNTRHCLDLREFALLNREQGGDRGFDVQMLEHVTKIARARLAQGIETYTCSSEGKDFFQRHTFRVESQRFVGKVSTVTEYKLRLEFQEASSVAQPLPTAKRQHETVERTPAHLRLSTAVAATPMAPQREVNGGAASSTIRRCPLRNEYIAQIQSGRKTHEGRIYSGQFCHYRAGDKICWHSQSKEVLTQIVSVSRFNNFEDMIRGVGYHRLLPTARSEQEAVGEYHKIPGYSDKVRQHGAVAFELRVLEAQSGSGESASKRGKAGDPFS